MQNQIRQKLYNENKLPETFLTPPIPAPHPNARSGWKRNWNVYHVYMNWDNEKYGKLTTIARWVAGIDEKKKLTRQRIDLIVRQVHWLLRDYMVLDYEHEIIEESTSTPPAVNE